MQSEAAKNEPDAENPEPTFGKVIRVILDVGLTVAPTAMPVTKPTPMAKSQVGSTWWMKVLQMSAVAM